MSLRIVAFFIHLVASSFVAVIAGALVFLLWYPSPLNQALGVTGIFGLILLVDVTLGPLLTLVVYKPGKPSLRFDMSVIVLLQLCALCYGLWAVSSQRPVWQVFNVDRFDLVQASEIPDGYRDKASGEFRRLSWFGPGWAAAFSPEDVEQRNALMFEAAETGVDLPQRPDLYRPLDSASQAIATRAFPLDRLELFNSPDAVSAELAKWPAATSWLPMMARAQPVTVLLDDSQQVVAVVDLRPWAE